MIALSPSFLSYAPPRLLTWTLSYSPLYFSFFSLPITRLNSSLHPEGTSPFQLTGPVEKKNPFLPTLCVTALCLFLVTSRGSRLCVAVTMLLCHCVNKWLQCMRKLLFKHMPSELECMQTYVEIHHLRKKTVLVQCDHLYSSWQPDHFLAAFLSFL